MAKIKPSLLRDEFDYSEFTGIPEGYPRGEFKSLHPQFTRKAHVSGTGPDKRRYYVDLSIGECNCQRGFAFNYNENKPLKPWYPAPYCVHKLRVMCATIASAESEGGVSQEDTALMKRAYLTALGTKYNPFETVSAFHKELRRGDFDQAWFWGLILSTKRGTRGVFQYMLNIIYEETRDHDLALHLINTLTDLRSITLSNLTRTISWFCASKKKWQLPHRMEIFKAEMLGYKDLAHKYTWSVARGGNIIPAEAENEFIRNLADGFRRKDLRQFQRGLKGLQKLKYTTLERDEEGLAKHRYEIYELLYDLANKDLKPNHDVWPVIEVINRRIHDGFGIGYHELNAIADALTGEPYEAGLLPQATRKRLLQRPTGLIPLGKWPPIPLYASDNHTYAGKALMRRFPNQLKPGAKQTDLDFRWCGAYFGVCWRMLAYNQHGTTDVAWEAVKWPQDLYAIVNAMWY